MAQGPKVGSGALAQYLQDREGYELDRKELNLLTLQALLYIVGAEMRRQARVGKGKEGRR